MPQLESALPTMAFLKDNRWSGCPGVVVWALQLLEHCLGRVGGLVATDGCGYGSTTHPHAAGISTLVLQIVPPPTHSPLPRKRQHKTSGGLGPRGA